jgi:hypothetical protein
VPVRRKIALSSHRQTPFWAGFFGFVIVDSTM